MTQGELADRIDVTRQTVNAIEQGKYSPSLEVAFKLSRFSGSPSKTCFNIRISSSPDSPPQTLRTDRLVLTPLQVGDSAEMVDVLADEELYLFTGGTPPSLEELESRFRLQVAGSSAVGEVWHNWIVRLADPGDCVGFVQATLEANTAALAWLVGLEWQGRGIATEAVIAIRGWLAARGVETFTAHIHPEHAASHGVATSLGLHPTELIDDDGEVVWSTD